jgi:hypothetical protein
MPAEFVLAWFLLELQDMGCCGIRFYGSWRVLT